MRQAQRSGRRGGDLLRLESLSAFEISRARLLGRSGVRDLFSVERLTAEVWEQGNA